MAHRLWPDYSAINGIPAERGHIETGLPFYETGGFMDRYQRIEEISLEQGFLPVSKPEQVEAMMLQAYAPHIGGAAKRIAEAVTRKRNEGNEVPLRVGRKLTRDYNGYAADANSSSRELTELSDILADANPELAMEQVVDETQPGLYKFLRFYDLSILKNTRSFKSIGYDPQLVKYNPENGGLIFFIGEALASWRVHQVMRRMPDARASETNRFSFWAERLNEIDKGYPALRSSVSERYAKINNSKSN